MKKANYLFLAALLLLGSFAWYLLPTTSAPSAGAAQSAIIYFSQEDRAQELAQELKRQTGAVLLPITAAAPYPSNIQLLEERSYEEMQRQYHPPILPIGTDLSSYRRIYLVYPNWWNGLPMAVHTFLDTYDLAGKTIAPLCVSTGAGLSRTVAELHQAEPEAAILPALHIHAASDSVKEEINAWLFTLQNA